MRETSAGLELDTSAQLAKAGFLLDNGVVFETPLVAHSGDGTVPFASLTLPDTARWSDKLLLTAFKFSKMVRVSCVPLCGALLIASAGTSRDATGPTLPALHIGHRQRRFVEYKIFAAKNVRRLADQDWLECGVAHCYWRCCHWRCCPGHSSRVPCCVLESRCAVVFVLSVRVCADVNVLFAQPLLQDIVSDDTVQYTVEGLRQGVSYEVLLSKTGSRPAVFRMWFASVTAAQSAGRTLLDTEKLIFTYDDTSQPHTHKHTTHSHSFLHSDTVRSFDGSQRMLFIQAHDESVPRSHRPIPFAVRVNENVIAGVPWPVVQPLVAVALLCVAAVLWIVRCNGYRRIVV